MARGAGLGHAVRDVPCGLCGGGSLFNTGGPPLPDFANGVLEEGLRPFESAENLPTLGVRRGRFPVSQIARILLIEFLGGAAGKGAQEMPAF
jgi:hypothetical protein